MNLDFHTVGAKTIVRHFYQKNYSIVLAINLSLYSDIHQTFLLILPHSVCHHNNVKAAARLIQYALFTLWRQNTINLCKEEEERGLSTEFKSFLL